MSPNLSSGHFMGNKLMYEQVIFNILSVIGAAHSLAQTYTKPDEDGDTLNMAVANKDLTVYPEMCSNIRNCRVCKDLKCRLCLECMDEKLRVALKKAYLEHMNRHEMRRVLPEPTNNQEPDKKFMSKILSISHEMDKLIALWFRGKCLQDVSWCL